MDIKLLDAYCKELDGFIADIKKNAASKLSQSKRNEAEKLSNFWFDNFSNKIVHPDILKDDLTSINNAFGEILILCRKPNRTSSFLAKFEVIYPIIFNNVFLKIRKNPVHSIQIVNFEEYLGKLDSDENEYLKEAIACCNSGFLKASIVLGWCATIDKIHKKIESIGFNQFNVTSLNMKNQTNGRFKRFNSSQNISSLSELRGVFDSDLLWIIEGMGLIDINQHTRLSSCFEMRCHSGHPGEAPITKYNTVSFFSDIFEIVLVNNNFSL